MNTHTPIKSDKSFDLSSLRAFSDASLLDPIKSSNIDAIKTAKESLKADFEREFGEQAFKTYYIGSPKKYTYDQDYTYDFDEAANTIHVTADRPKLKTKECKFHVKHEMFSDDFGIQFASKEGPLHVTKFQPYFMAMAMHQLTGDKIYDELASDLFDEIQAAVAVSMQDGFDPIEDWEWSAIVDSISTSVDTMIQHRQPNSLAMADLIPKDRDATPPPEHLLK